jgi:hypothetical protein
MCYNCGCGKPGDDMGDPKNITDKTFEEAAKASKQSPKEAKRNTLELLKILLITIRRAGVSLNGETSDRFSLRRGLSS